MMVRLKALIALIVTAFVAGLAVSFAVASPGNGNGQGKGKKPSASTGTQTTTTTTRGKKPPKSGPSCRPNVSLILRGTLVSAGGQSLAMDVTQTNAHARVYRGTQVNVEVSDKTKIQRLGKRVTLADLIAGDRLNVQARACKAEAGVGTALAVRIVALPAKKAPPTTTTTETTTTETITTETTETTTTSGS
jgi:hypothetical protein